MNAGWVVFAGLAGLILVAAGVGFLAGSSKAPTDDDAVQERNEAFKTGFRTSFAVSFRDANERGTKAGLKRGSRQGNDDGTANGSSIGATKAQDELDLIAAQQARLAAEAEAAERAANCGHVLFVDGACPTDAEVQYEEDAETYCGGGDYETAAALGIEC